MDWINIHTHQIGEGINVVDPCLGSVGELESGMVYVSKGIHPMYIDKQTELLMAEIEKSAHEGTIVAIGEAGLDRNASTSMEEQRRWFEWQVKIAVQYNLPLIIHVVRAVPELITIRKKYSRHQKWIIHGFNQRLEVLQELLKHGFYISVGRQIMNEKSNAYKYLLEIPNELLFIETDDSDFKIAEIYHRVAELRGISIQKLQRIIKLNFDKLFPV